MGPDTGLFLQQRQSMSQIQIQSLMILQMDNIELKEFLKNEYLENPLLDLRSHESTDASVPSISYGSNFHDFAESSRKVLEIADQRVWNMRCFVSEQLPPSLPPWQYSLSEYLAECLQDNGYLTMSTAEIQEKTGVPEPMVQETLKLLKQLEPAGIFASGLKECLLLQLDRKIQRFNEPSCPADDSSFETPDHSILLQTDGLTRLEARLDLPFNHIAQKPVQTGTAGDDAFLAQILARRILAQYTEELICGRIGAISRALGISTRSIRKAIKEIALLEPSPMQGFGLIEGIYIEPDVIIRKAENGDYSVEVNDQWIENYSLNDYYISMMQTTEDEDFRAYFKEKLNRIRLFQNAIRQRRQTLTRITAQIAEWQKFFTKGRIAMTMSALAERLKYSVSTVSRAIRGKYLQYPGGIIRFRDLFSAPTGRKPGKEEDGKTADGIWKRDEKTTVSEAQERIRKLIEKEPHGKPYSDRKLCELLEEEGIRLSRRAVASYREQMGIPGSFDRRM